MENSSIYCLVDDAAQASSLVEDLKDAGFENQCICVLMPDLRSTRDFAQEKETRVPDSLDPSEEQTSPDSDRDPRLLARAMMEMGIPELQAKVYEPALLKGRALILVDAQSLATTRVANEIFGRHRGGEASLLRPEANEVLVK